MSENETPIPPQTPVDEPLPATPAPAETPGTPLDDVPVDEQRSLDGSPVLASNDIVDHPSAQEAVPEDDAGNAPKDRPELYVGFKLPEGANPHVADVKSPFFKMVEGTADDYHISFIPIGVKEFNSFVEAFPSINMNLGTANQEWAEQFDEGKKILNHSSFMEHEIEGADRKWAQRVPYGTGTLGVMRPSLRRDGGNGAELSGEMATVQVRQQLGLGVPSTFPLWHSGFWLSLKAPTTTQRLDLQERLDAEKVQLGRDGQGFTFSNDSVYLKSYLADFALLQVTSANVHYQSPLELKDLILANDINTLIWGVLTALYPHGYPYHQPCVNDPTQCTHIVKDMVDLYKVHYVDYQKLTDAQLAHMGNRMERVSKEKLEAYRLQHAYASEGPITLEGETGKLKVQLKVPTVAEYTISGMSWIEGIVADVQRAFGSDITGEQRNRYIDDRGTATSMATYAHWVKEIGLESGGKIVDASTIQQTLAEISYDVQLRKAFLAAVQSYAERCSITVEALPKFDCPACGRKPTEDELKHPYLAPINVEALFFTMQGQHIRKVLS